MRLKILLSLLVSILSIILEGQVSASNTYIIGYTSRDVKEDAFLSIETMADCKSELACGAQCSAKEDSHGCTAFRY